ncbi:hypothetical protein R3P38DRAFT_2791380 [Favolaschia claudopus]|uniref:Uncharacterized protein n=1 Tax=Favolaschia claudopus TaxID=2862362 RepID=A0AAW0AHD8_9AGAR
MFSTRKAFFIAASLVGATNAFNGTVSIAEVALNSISPPANLGFYGTTSCSCPPWNGPYAVAIPRALAGTAEVCCNVGITISYLDQTVDAVFSGYYEDGAGTENIALSPAAFAALAGFPWETSLAPVNWSFDN